MSTESVKRISPGFPGNCRGDDKLLTFISFKLCVRPGLYVVVNHKTGAFFAMVSSHQYVNSGTGVLVLKTLELKSIFRKYPEGIYIPLMINQK